MRGTVVAARPRRAANWTIDRKVRHPLRKHSAFRPPQSYRFIASTDPAPLAELAVAWSVGVTPLEANYAPRYVHPHSRPSTGPSRAAGERRRSDTSSSASRPTKPPRDGETNTAELATGRREAGRSHVQQAAEFKNVGFLWDSAEKRQISEKSQPPPTEVRGGFHCRADRI